MAFVFTILGVGLLVWLAVRLPKEARNPSWRLWLIFPPVLFLAFGCLLVGAAAFIWRQATHRTVTDPAAVFTQRTGLPWPQSAKIASVADDHGSVPMSSEGELYIVFELDAEDIERLLKGPPPWGTNEWQGGPVPTEIGSHCSFGTSGVGTARSGSEPAHYTGDFQLTKLLGSGDVVYAANERCCESLRWHNGSLLVIDPKTTAFGCQSGIFDCQSCLFFRIVRCMERWGAEMLEAPKITGPCRSLFPAELQ